MRLSDARNYVISKLLEEPSALGREGLAHLFAVSELAMLLAARRGENVELAGIAGIFHDLSFYSGGSALGHAHKSAALARNYLSKSGSFTREEEERVVGAIYYHSEKDKRHMPFDELLKDADVAAYALDHPDEIGERERERWEKMKIELSLL